jgi:aminoglycoside phosphotransferase (APT) family kinase protein
MTVEAEVKGSMEGSVKNAKALFARIDPDRLQRFIEQQDDVEGSVVLSELVYPSEGAGSSNGIAFFKATVDRGQGRETLDLVLRYSPGKQLLKQKTYGAEVLTLRAVAAAGLAAPHPLWLDPDGGQIGHEGFVMERVVGDTPSAAMYSSGPLANVSAEVRKERMLKAADYHGRLRKAALGPDRVPHLVGRGDGETAIERELNWWFNEVLLVWPADDPKVATIRALRDWMIKRQPHDLYPAVLVHGDAQIANIIYRDGEIAAVIDWELSYLGHNESDLALLVFLTETQNVTDTQVDGVPTEADYVRRFEQASGGKVAHWPYFKLMNMYRVVSVSSLSAEFMPSFEAVWTFFEGYMRRAWDEAKASYSD